LGWTERAKEESAAKQQKTRISERNHGQPKENKDGQRKDKGIDMNRTEIKKRNTKTGSICRCNKAHKRAGQNSSKAGQAKGEEKEQNNRRRHNLGIQNADSEMNGMQKRRNIARHQVYGDT
jgi:hypothetical protein